MIVYLPRTKAFSEYSNNGTPDFNNTVALEKVRPEISALGEELSRVYSTSRCWGAPLRPGFIVCQITPRRAFIFHTWDVGYPAIGEFNSAGEFLPYTS